MTGLESEGLDADFAALVEDIAADGLPAWSSLSVEAARRLEDELFGAGGGPEMASVRDLAIDGPGGGLPIRVYRPESAAADDAEPGTLVFFHGGVFVLGTLDSADDICRELAARTGCVVFSVDYRLAPEDPFPAAVDDAAAATAWARENAAAFGADPERLGVVGSSAGGAIAAATALRAAANDLDIALQVLLYPMCSPESAYPGVRTTDEALDVDGEGNGADDDSDEENGDDVADGAGGDELLRASYGEHDDAALLSTADVAWGWEQYLRSPVDAYNPFAAPLCARPDLLADAAPAVVATGGVDVLRDEGAAYADALAAAGVDVTHAHYPTLAHGFCSVTDAVTVADDATDDIAAEIRNYIG